MSPSVESVKIPVPSMSRIDFETSSARRRCASGDGGVFHGVPIFHTHGSCEPVLCREYRVSCVAFTSMLIPCREPIDDGAADSAGEISRCHGQRAFRLPRNCVLIPDLEDSISGG